MDPDYEDQCIGGWIGHVSEIHRESDPITVTITWDEKTLTELIGEEALAQMDRQGLDGRRMGLHLTEVERSDQATGTRSPQPADPAARLIGARGLSLDEDEKRIARILGSPEEEVLPEVTDETLEIYHRYLKAHLSFPFDGEYSRETGPLEDTYYRINVTGLVDPEDCDEFYGLLCEGRQDRRKVMVPLAEVEVDEKDPNGQLIEDYHVWFWNYR